MHVTVNVSGAEIAVDGESVGQSPLADPVDVSPGSHSVEARYAGRSTSSTVNAPAGKVVNVPLNLDAAAGGAAAAPPAGAAPVPAATPSGDDSAPATGASGDSPKANGASPATETTDVGVDVATGGREPFFSWLFRSPIGLAGLGITAVGSGVGLGF